MLFSAMIVIQEGCCDTFCVLTAAVSSTRFTYSRVQFRIICLLTHTHSLHWSLADRLHVLASCIIYRLPIV